VGGVAAAYVLTDGPGPPFVTAEGLQLRGGSATPSKVARRSQAWCGSDTSAVDRTPDAVGGEQIHVIYACRADIGTGVITAMSRCTSSPTTSAPFRPTARRTHAPATTRTSATTRTT
jgi:hypothetical protein